MTIHSSQFFQKKFNSDNGVAIWQQTQLHNLIYMYVYAFVGMSEDLWSP